MRLESQPSSERPRSSLGRTVIMGHPLPAAPGDATLPWRPRVAREGAVVSATLAAALAETTLPEADGHAVRLGSLWESGPGVLVFLRHYG